MTLRTGPHFDGVTYDKNLDHAPLTGQLERVYLLMQDGQWRTLDQIAEAVGGSQAGVSARLRDFRKPKFGGMIVDRRRVFGRLYEYRIRKQ
jgi:hypothetical protein